jgi:L-lactate dehydrogenase complex protein LldG
VDARSEILSRIRRALHGVPQVPLPSGGPPPEAAAYRAEIGGNLVERFTREAEGLGVRVYRTDPQRLLEVVVGILRAERAQRVGVSERVGWMAPLLQTKGFTVGGADQAERVEIGITGADYGLAATGTLVLLSGPEQDRVLSLLPPVHVAILPEDRLVVDLHALFERIRPEALPSALLLITGPSRTADIEQTLTPGVHGPGIVHVVLVR